MTYRELASELLRLHGGPGSSVYEVQQPGFHTTALYIRPVRWWVAFEPAGTLFSGTYEPGTLRLVGDRQTPFTDLKPRVLAAEIGLAKGLRQALDALRRGPPLRPGQADEIP